MKPFIEALNHPAEAFQKGENTVSWGLVIITILINSIFEPVLRHFFGVNAPNINILSILKITVLGMICYVVISIAFWVVCTIFGSKKSLSAHIRAWGISFAPTAICSVVVAVTEVFFFVFWNSTLWGMLLNIVFVGILIWKAILYFVYLREFAGLKGWHFLEACVVMGIIILMMAALDGYMGLKTPII